jgi:UDP-N-acetylmuramoyl-tripeptide--D-alanyl-D-alanine ligase
MFLLLHVSLVLALAGVVLTLVRTMHMFQLNSYKMNAQLNWLKKNTGKFRAHLLILLLSGLAFTGSAVVYWLLTALLLFFIPLLRPPKAKKPLVYTPRVRRMLVTAAVLLAAWALAVELLPLTCGYFVLCLGFAASPLLVLLANVINMPVERAFVRYYINDARNMLRSLPGLTVVGITGSYGKTSVKYYLSTLLRARFNVLMTPESYNTTLGVVRTIREGLRPTHEVFVCEMGARNIGDIREICEIVRPKYAILTAIGEQHLESFKTLANIVKTKFELADSIPADGKVFLNDRIERRPAQPFAAYGVSEESAYRVRDIRVSRQGTSFRVATPDGEAEFQTRLIGEHNVMNLTGAIAVAHTLGVPLDELQSQMRKIEPVPHRMQLIENGAMTIIDDAYNSNPSGCRAALKTLAMFDACKVLITPGMVELGAKQDECNCEFGREAAAVCDFVALVGEEQARPILRGLREAGYPEENIFVAGGFNEAMAKVNSIQSEKRKVVLLENDLPDNY